MANMQTELQVLGWNDWFEHRNHCPDGNVLARVAAVDRDQLLVMDPGGVFRARLAGRFLHRHVLPHERPCVGDWVCLERTPGDGFALVTDCLERRTSLCRKMAGSAVESQMIAANVDDVIIVQSCQFDFNVKRLERYLVMVLEGGAHPCILLTKTDLVDAAVLHMQMAEIRAAGITAPVLTLSNVTRDGLETLRQWLVPGHTCCFVGSSGVGKSSLINLLTERTACATGTVSATGEGRHTTVRRELILLEGGALVIDNPGMREFGIAGAEAGLQNAGSDIEALAGQCRYRDCTHVSEPGCAVQAALQSGALTQEHLDNFLKMRKESEFYEMSHVQRRRKDRAFGRHVREVMKKRDR